MGKVVRVPAPTKTCVECGNNFTGRRHSRTCSKMCAFWALVDKNTGSGACWPWRRDVSQASTIRQARSGATGRHVA
jgi:hypothetical protein